MLSRDTLKRSSRLVEYVRAIRRTRARLVGGSQYNYDLGELLRLFSPDGIASPRLRGTIATQAANRTLPLLAGLLHDPLTPVPITFACPSNPGTAELAHLFNFHGSDKSTNHNYELLYSHLLHSRRAERLHLLEIGLGTNNTDVAGHMGRSGRPGASLRAFRHYLRHALIYGADIDDRVLFEEENIKTYPVDQTNPQSMAFLGERIGHRLDLIIDDGLHAPHANLGSVYFALNYLAPRGILVIEDIRPEAVPIWQLVAHLLPWSCQLLQAKQGLMFVCRS